LRWSDFVPQETLFWRRSAWERCGGIDTRKARLGCALRHGLQYWLHIGFPVLMPSVLGATILLFGNSFAAYATASQLTGGAVGLVPIIIGQNIGGDVLSNPRLSQALAFGMIVVIGLSMVLYALVQRRASRWRR